MILEMKKKGIAGNIDVFIGQKIFLLRQIHVMSQEKLSEKMGITFQQIQKYEKGQNRISAARLYDIAKIFKVSVEFFMMAIRSLLKEKYLYP